jgi:hypothetical protein
MIDAASTFRKVMGAYKPTFLWAYEIAMALETFTLFISLIL